MIHIDPPCLAAKFSPDRSNRNGWQDFRKVLQGLSQFLQWQWCALSAVKRGSLQSSCCFVSTFTTHGCEDANMIDKSLTKTDVDLIFAKVVEPLVHFINLFWFARFCMVDKVLEPCSSVLSQIGWLTYPAFVFSFDLSLCRKSGRHVFVRFTCDWGKEAAELAWNISMQH